MGSCAGHAGKNGPDTGRSPGPMGRSRTEVRPHWLALALQTTRDLSRSNFLSPMPFTRFSS